MASYYKEGSKITYNGIRGSVIKITETYRKNVLVVKVTELPKNNFLKRSIVEKIEI